MTLWEMRRLRWKAWKQQQLLLASKNDLQDEHQSSDTESDQLPFVSRSEVDVVASGNEVENN